MLPLSLTVGVAMKLVPVRVICVVGALVGICVMEVWVGTGVSQELSEIKSTSGAKH